MDYSGLNQVHIQKAHRNKRLTIQKHSVIMISGHNLEVAV